MGLRRTLQCHRIALLLTLPWPTPAFIKPALRSSRLHAPCIRDYHSSSPSWQARGSTSRRAGGETASMKGSSLDTLAPPLTTERVLGFDRKGHMSLRGLLSKEEMERWSPALMKAFQDEELEAYRHEVRVFFGDEAYEKARTMEQCRRALEAKMEDDNTPFLQVFNLWRRHSHLKDFCLAKRFGHVAAQLLGAERVRLYQDSMFIKRPGDGPTLYHTDVGTSPLDTNSMLTFWIPLTPVPTAEEGGSPLLFATGSHRDMSFSHWWGPQNDDDDLLEARYSLDDHAPLALGDVTIHHGWCLHGSPSNELKDARVAFSLAFIADGARTIADTAEFEPDEEDSCSYDDWIQYIEPGDVVDHELVPVVYP